jgi:hypothetical protein
MDHLFREQHDVLGDLDGALVGAGQQLPGTHETLALVEGAQRQDGLPPGLAPTHSERFIRWVASVLHAASTTPEPMGRFCACACA